MNVALPKHPLALAASLVAAACASHPPTQAAEPAPGRIVFSSNRSSAWRLWIVNTDGSGLKPLAPRDTRGQDVDPVFSPDAKHILFTSTRDGKTCIWRMRADGTAPERLCDGDQAEWAPDGASIVLRRAERILTRHLASGTETILTPADWPHCSGPAWSPDGKSVAFAARWNAGNGLYIVPANGGRPLKVYDKQGACEPHWSPDGTRLVYETETHIGTLSPDGTRNRLVTYFGGVQRYARFSPDGTRIVFCQGASEHGPWELYLIPAAGGSPRQLTRGGSDLHPDWR
ncbi:MAG: PD40 domain-containing protein [Verrucomicrobia bacterium]|nr:PD40 domain-containing protein [Verrucomicrobiota bacterium]